MSLQFRMLGPLEVLRDGAPVRLPAGRARRLLALLLVHAGRPVAAEAAIDALWGDDPPRSAAHALQVYVSTLRRTLEAGPGDPGVLLLTPAGYVLAAGADGCDAARFAALVAAAGSARTAEVRTAEEAQRQAGLLREALALWRGPVLADFVGEEFAAAEAARLDALRLSALERVVAAELDLGRHAQLVDELEGHVRAHPFREALWESLMLALYRCGRQADALAAYRRARAVLADELGLEPGPGLRRLHDAVLAHDPALAAGPGSATPAPGAGSRPARPAGPGPVPARLRQARPGTFVGREAELQGLWSALDRSTLTGRQIALVEGEPGIGKTTLAAEFGAAAGRRGATVLYGRCEDGLGLPYQPFAEALGQYVEQAPPALLAEHVATYGGALQALAPGLAGRVRDLPPFAHADADRGRLQLFAAVAGLLREAARGRELLLVLDDLHWADEATLGLLRFLCGTELDVPLLLVLAYRGSDVTAAHGLADILGRLRPEPGAAWIPLRGLATTEVAALVASVLPSAAAPTAAAELVELTQGNPFFVREMVRHGRGAGGTPVSVQDVVRGRVERLGAGALEVLTVAAVAGRESDVELLADACGRRVGDVLPVLEAARDAALLEEVAAARFAFTHAVVQYTLRDALGATRLAYTHRAIAEALERRHGQGPGPYVGEIAEHWYAAVAVARPAAVAYARWAGEAAVRQFAFDAAAGWFARALDLSPDGAEEVRLDILQALGEAQRLAGLPAHRETLLAAAALARRVGDARRLARAALANSRGTLSRLGSVDAERVAALRAALAFSGEDSVARALLLGTLAVELTFENDEQSRLGMVRQAREMARGLGDPAAQVRVTNLTYDAIWVPDTLDERLATTAEALALARALPDAAALHAALRYHSYCRVEAGDLDGFRAMQVELAAAAEATRDPMHLFINDILGVWLTTLAGDLGAAAAEVDRLSRTVAAYGYADLAAWAICHARLEISRQQGRAGDLAPEVAALMEQWPGMRYLRAELARIHCETGRPDLAAELVAADWADGFASIPVDFERVYALTCHADVVAELGDREAAGRLYGLLTPYAGRIAYAWASSGPAVDHYLGVLARTCGSAAAAARHLDAAARIHERLRVPAWLAATRLERARTLQETPGADPDEIARLRSEVLGAARRYGFAALDTRLRTHI